jgi:small subunit ribosomal protein S27Ae
MGEKKPRRKRKPINAWKFFEKKGSSVERKRKSCPKCGKGVFMAQHKGRVTCGKCHYSEFELKKKEEPKKKETPKEKPKK